MDVQKAIERLKASISVKEFMIAQAKKSGNQIEEQRNKRELKALKRQLKDLERMQ